MTEEKTEIQSSKRIVSEARGKYTVVDDTKVFYFEFPMASSLLVNYEIVSYLKDEIWRAIEMQKKKEDEEKKADNEKKKTES